MNDKKQSSSNHDLQDHINVQHEHIPRWKRIHHTWWFWIFWVLMLVGIMYYIMSVNFTFAPHKQMRQPSEQNRTP